MKIFRPNHQAAYPISWTWTVISGPDTKDFLHRLSTVDVKNLRLNHGSPGCFLDPHGKINAYFRLWHFSPNEYAFEFDAGPQNQWKSHLLNFIDRYTFAEKLTLSDVTDQLSSVFVFFDSEDELITLGIPPLNPYESQTIEGELRVCHQSAVEYGRPWISIWGKTENIALWEKKFFSDSTPATSEEVETWRILATQPKVEREITLSVTPLEVGLRRAIADQKGCYPGQEIIEKIISLGSPPKRLAKINGIGPLPKQSDPILNFSEPPVEVGTITSSISTGITTAGEEYIALGLLKKIHAKEGLKVQFTSSSPNEGVIIQVTTYD